MEKNKPIPDHWQDQNFVKFSSSENSNVFYSRWKNALRLLSEDLEALTKTTESEFLSIGEALQEFSLQAKDISEMAMAGAHLLTGEEIAGAIGELQDMLERISRYLQFCEQLSDNDIKILQDVIQKIEGMDQPLEAFARVAMKLRILGISTRIENAYLDNTQYRFDHLVEGVVKLSDVIQSKSEEIRKGARSLGLITRERLVIITSLQNVQYRQATVIIENVQECLHFLREEHQLSSDMVKRISRQSHEVSQRIGEIVTSMQFHDITRQKVEHVKEAIDAAVEKINRGTTQLNGQEDASDVPEKDQSLIGTFGDICVLQSAQLRNAKKEVLAALESVINSLSGIQQGIVDISLEAQKTVSSTDEDSKSFVGRMETDIDNVTSSLNGNIEANQELMQAMGLVTKMVDEMGSFVGDIDRFGSEIKMIAMNGQIKASHLGDTGAAMSVLADAIQHLSSEAHTQIIAVSESLKSIVCTTNGIKSERISEGSETETRAIVDKMIEDLDGLLCTVKGTNDKAMIQLGELQKDVKPFSGKLQDVMSQITVNTTFENVLGKSINNLEEIVDELQSAGYDSSNIKNVESVESLEDRYTMDSERHVHRALFASESAGENKNQRTLEGENTEDDLGNNVELF